MAEHDLFPKNRETSGAGDSKALTNPPERQHAKPVAKRIASRKKKTFGQNFVELFLADDVGDIGTYLVKDLIVPTIKDVFLNFMTAALWGDRRSGSIYRDSGRQRTNYNGVSRNQAPRRERDREDYSAGKRDFDLDNLVFNTREEADIVLTRLEDYMVDYGQVTVGYLLELMDESGPYTAEYYGWRNLDRASVRRVRNGYALDLPRPVRIER